MKKAILFSLLSFFLFSCESYHNKDFQERQEANQESAAQPTTISGPEKGGNAGSR